MEYGGIHGIRDAILMPDTDQYTVILLVLPVDNPALFSKKEANSGEPRGVPLGRLGKADANKWAEAFAGRSNPRGEADLRWWDGSQWTENTHQTGT